MFEDDEVAGTDIQIDNSSTGDQDTTKQSAVSHRKTGARTTSGVKNVLYENALLIDTVVQLQSYRRRHQKKGRMLGIQPLGERMGVEYKTLGRFLKGNFGFCHEVKMYLKFIDSIGFQDDPRQLKFKLTVHPACAVTLSAIWAANKRNLRSS